jgi:hypothetical protein
MSTEEAKLIVDTVIDWLHQHNRITEDQYGNMPEADREAIADAVIEAYES